MLPGSFNKGDMMVTFIPLTEEEREPLVSFLGGYLKGMCFIFAIAVARGTGEQLIVVEDRSGIVHAGLRTGTGMCKDIRGEMDQASFTEVFVSGDHLIRETSEEELLRVSLAANNEPISEDMIAQARRHAESVWPMWPWKGGHLDQVTKFVEELEVLCRKYGVWLREPYPTTLPLVYPSDGEEKGFELVQLPNVSNQYMLRRVLR